MSKRDEDSRLKKPTQMQVRVLKCRETGDTGLADLLDYNRKTGRIELVQSSDDCPFDIVPEEGKDDF